VSQELLREHLSAWESIEKHARAQVKLCKDLGDCLSRGDLGKVLKLLSQLQSGPSAPDLSGLESVRQWCAQEERQRPLRLARQLREAAEAAQVPCTMVGDSPPTLRLDPVQVELDFKKSEAILSYARQELARCPLDCEQIMRERSRQLAHLESEFDPPDYLARLYEAYRRGLAGQKWGERVDLVDLLPELAFLLQSERFRKDPSKELFRPYSRVRFAYDLARLRKSRQLEHLGSRLTLGTATLGSTRDKSRVLYLEEAQQGQFYLSLAFQGAPPR
jgi:hypothetical protein